MGGGVTAGTGVGMDVGGESLVGVAVGAMACG